MFANHKRQNSLWLSFIDEDTVFLHNFRMVIRVSSEAQTVMTKTSYFKSLSVKTNQFFYDIGT